MIKDTFISLKCSIVLLFEHYYHFYQVYEVLDESSNLRAIKVVNMEDADDETIASYKNEINLLNRLQYSDRIIKMYDL